MFRIISIRLINRITKFLQWSIICLVSLTLSLTLGLAGFGSIINIYFKSLPSPEKTIHGTLVAESLANGHQIDVSELDSLVQRKIITPSELRLLQSESPIQRAIVWHVLLPAYHIYPYPASLYTNLPFDTTSYSPNQPYIDAQVAAITCNLTTPYVDPWGYMTVAEFNILDDLLQSGDVTLPDPGITLFPRFDDQTWNADTYRGRNSIISAWNNLPLSWRSDFLQNDWQFSFTLPDIVNYDGGTISRHKVSGLIDTSTKTISIDTSDPSTTYHEFAHYASIRVGWCSDSTLDALFICESSAVQYILDDYSQTSSREFFAEFVSDWFIHPEHRSELIKLAPQTASHVQLLIDDYPNLLLAP